MADAYLQSLLADGETIRSEARQHPMALIRFALQPILVFLAALVCLAIGMWLTPDGEGLFSDIVRWIDTLLGLVTAGLFILAIAWFPIQVFRWLQRRYLVTDRRVLYVDGVLRKNSMDAGLSMITDVSFRQGFVGRRLGYGDLVVATASNRPLHFRQIRDALAFKQAIMTAQHATVEARADEILVSKGLAPTSATEVAATAAPVGEAATIAAVAAAPAEPVAPPVPAWDGSDVPQMTEDDVPPSDPAIFGAPSQADPVSDAVDAVADVADEAAEEDADVAGEAPEAVEAAADGAAEEVADVADEATDVATDAAGEADGIAEAVETAEPVAPGGHMAALDDVDSKLGDIGEDAKGTGADSVTSAIATLAELRDSGAITNEEYETRKQELLDRL